MKFSLFKVKYLFLILIIFNIILAARWVIDGNIFFHTDIARDFLLMEDIIDNKNPTLIGQRSGAIPGLFHGPLWLYLNIPAFMIGSGDPITVGWFWVILYVISLMVIYYVGRKMFGTEGGILATLLLSVVTILFVRSLFNPYGALVISPLFFYFFHLYIQNHQAKFLILALFLLGLIIQFQIAFGLPILLLTFFYLLYYLYKNKKLSHLLSFFVLLIPLSSYLLFEIRNNFLQTTSVINYLMGAQSHGKLDLNIFQLITIRIKESIIDGWGMMTQNNFLTFAIFASLIFAVKSVYKSNQKVRFYLLFFYFYFGFWFLTIFFKGTVWNYYYLPFIPLLILILVSVKNKVNKIIFYVLFFSIYIFNLQIAIKDISDYDTNPNNGDVSTWKFNQLIAKTIFEKDGEFGYFIFTPDLYGYSPRYALNFYAKQYPTSKVDPYQKKEITYLIIAPPPPYGRDPEGIWYQKNINSASWKKNDVKINKNYEEIITFPNDFVIEKYRLTTDEINIKPNPYLIQGIFFR